MLKTLLKHTNQLSGMNTAYFVYKRPDTYNRALLCDCAPTFT